MTANLADARAFCKHCHAGQTRWDGSPYHVHPERVADRVRGLLAEAFPHADDPSGTGGAPADEPVLIAALLHDVLEDCRVDYEDIAGRFGGEVADMVAALSDDKRLPEARRAAEYRAALRSAPRRVQLIKLADLLDNAADLAGCADAARRRRWAAKALDLLDALPAVAGLPSAAGLRAELETAARAG